MSETLAQMPRYTCHKEVHALKIKRTIDHPNGSVDLFFEDERFASINIDDDQEVQRFRGKESLGGYLVVYSDGYRSWSPTAVFEEGYTRL